jgi:hypothetical protein
MTLAHRNRFDATLTSIFEPLESRQMFAAGALDTSFSLDGKQFAKLLSVRPSLIRTDAPLGSKLIPPLTPDRCPECGAVPAGGRAIGCPT